MADEENATVGEEATEDVTLSSEDQGTEKETDQATEESTEGSDNPREGENTSEESAEDEVKKLSPRYERDNRRLNEMLRKKNEELERLRKLALGKGEPTPALTPEGVPAIGVGGYELAKVQAEVEAVKMQLRQKAEEEFWNRDQQNFDRVLEEYPELKKNADLLRMIKNDARADVKAGEHADYLKTAKKLNKILNFAKAEGREESKMREETIDQGSSPKAKRVNVKNVSKREALVQKIKSGRYSSYDLAEYFSMN